MAKTYRPYNPNQTSLIPINPADLLPSDHPVFFIDGLVDKLDLTSIVQPIENSKMGQPPHHPVMMVKILFYAYSQGVHSSRAIEKNLIESIPFRILAAGNQPEQSTIHRFRANHIDQLAELFAQVFVLCDDARLVDRRHIAIDGSKIQANASRHKAMSYGRMQAKRDALRDEIKKHLEEANRLDEEEDEQGLGVPNRLGPDFDTKQKRLEKIEQAMRELEERTRAEKGPNATPADSMQYNFTDAESRISPRSDNKKAFEQHYNGQISVDSKDQIIVAWDATNQVHDSPHFKPMLDQSVERLGRAPRVASADAGYHTLPNVAYANGMVEVVLIPPDRQKHGREAPPAPRGRIPAALSPRDRMRRKLRTKQGKALYARRKAIVEPVFGVIKRVLGFRRFSGRGLARARSEFGFVATVYNAMRLFWSRGVAGLGA